MPAESNAILSGITLPAAARGQRPAGQPTGVRKPSGGASEDVFVQGQWWANQAKAKDSAPEAGEVKRGGNRLPRTAARAYGNQQNAGSPGDAGTGKTSGTAAQGDQAGGVKSGDGATILPLPLRIRELRPVLNARRTALP